jgi:MFS family permease
MPFWLRHFADKSNNYELTASQDSLIVSILSAGTFFGALMAAYLPDLIGRRYGLMFGAGIVFNLGIILQTISMSRPAFIAGRFFAGLGVGLVSAMSKLNYTQPLSTESDLFSSTLPVRNCTKMDSRDYCQLLPTFYYPWSFLGCNRE